MIFKHHDYKQTGLVSISAFKETLKSANFTLTPDESLQLIKILDRDVTGMVNYNKFINEILKPYSIV